MRMPTRGMLGKRHSEETKRKMSLAKKGKRFSEEHKNKLSIAHTGKKRPWQKENKFFLGKNHTEESKKKMRDKRLGKPRFDLRGEKNYNWKGGIYPINLKIRDSLEYKIWRRAVFERDKYTCVWCGIKFIKGVIRSVILHVDHIKPFYLYPELRFAIDNGRTLCKPCHMKTDTYGRQKKELLN